MWRHVYIHFPDLDKVLTFAGKYLDRAFPATGSYLSPQDQLALKNLAASIQSVADKAKGISTKLPESSKRG